LRSRYDDITFPIMPLTDYVLDSGAPPQRPAFVDASTGDTLTFGELGEQIDTLAGGLIGSGLRPGDVAAIISPNSVEYAVVFHAVLRAGAVVTPLNPAYTVEEIAHQLADSTARVVFTVPSCLDRVDAAAASLGVDVVLIGVSAEGRDTAALAAEPRSVPLPEVDPETALAVLPYSSGTTGLPKGVMLTHRNLVANIAQFRRMVDVQPETDRLIAVLPFFHIYGLTVLMNFGIQAGITVVTMPRFNLAGFLGAIERHRITRACVAPPIVLALAKDASVDNFDLGSLRTLLSGAAPLDSALAQACQDRLGAGVAVLQGYGMTELSPVSHTSPEPGCEPPGGGPAPYGTIGYAAPNTECRIVDPVTGVDAEPGSTGELWVRGPQVMTGYLNDPAATAQTLDDAGWLRTGDIATVDEAGCYRIVDRLKELIKYKGFQVPPAELEAVLLAHPDIVDAAVVGIPDDAAGEVPKAFVVRRAGSTMDAPAVQSYVAERVAPHKRIRSVEFIDSVPKSSAGKILRNQLRAG
jgi:acyl-CoA synthetase (AMP-forming)/AMP-acid ligase II